MVDVLSAAGGTDMIVTRLPLLVAMRLMQAVAEESLLPLLDFAAPDAARR